MPVAAVGRTSIVFASLSRYMHAPAHAASRPRVRGGGDHAPARAPLLSLAAHGARHGARRARHGACRAHVAERGCVSSLQSRAPRTPARHASSNLESSRRSPGTKSRHGNATNLWRFEPGLELELNCHQLTLPRRRGTARWQETQETHCPGSTSWRIQRRSGSSPRCALRRRRSNRRRDRTPHPLPSWAAFPVCPP